MTVGTRFVRQHIAPWSGPCPACGHNRPTHYTRDDSDRRRRITCTSHARNHGIERATLVCEVTEIGAHHVSYRVVEVTHVQDVLPGGKGPQAGSHDGGYAISHFLGCVADGSVRILTLE